jgi:tRNA C32,U32 (ribose-2'-O)-methylase TrmJ
MACQGVDILEKATIHLKFKDAIKDKNLVRLCPVHSEAQSALSSLRT